MSAADLRPATAGWHPDPAGGGRLRFHDGIGWTAQVSHAEPARPLSEGFARLSDWLSRLITTYAVVCVLLAGYALWGVAVAKRVATTPGLDLTTDPPQVPPGLAADVAPFMDVGLVLLTLSSVVSLLAGLLWLVWQYKLAVSAPTALRRSPGMHVLSWFIPFVNCWFPLQNVSGLWRAYGTGRQESQAEASPLLLPVWWLSYLLLPLVPAAGVVLAAVSTDPGAPEQLLSGIALCYAVTFGLLAGVSLLARQVVRRLSWRALVHHAESV